MNKFLIYSGLISSIIFGAEQAKAEQLTLPAPDISSPLMRIIDARSSGRTYSKQKISEQELSNLLWAAFGTNSRQTRTIPTSRNQQKLKIFVVYNGSVWQYDGKENVMNKVSNDDLMPYLAQQSFVHEAPVHLIYAGDKKSAEVHSGSSYENVSLYAAEKGLASVVRGLIDRDGLHKALNLGDDEVVTYHQTIGYPAE